MSKLKHAALGNWNINTTDDGKTLFVNLGGESGYLAVHHEPNGLVVCAHPPNSEPVLSLAVPFATLEPKR